MKNGTTTLRPASDRSRPAPSATRHLNIPVDESVADKRRGLLINLLSDAIEDGPLDAKTTLCALIGTSLVEVPGCDLNSRIRSCDKDLQEELWGIAQIIDRDGVCAAFHNLLRQSKSFGEYVAMVRASGAWTRSPSARERLEEHFGDMLDVYLRLWELRAKIVGADRERWWEVKAPQLSAAPLSATTAGPKAPPIPGENPSLLEIPFTLIEAAYDSSPANLQAALRRLVDSQMLIYPGHAERADRIANKIELAIENIDQGVALDHLNLPREAFFVAARRDIADAKTAELGYGYAEMSLELIDEAYREATELSHELRELTCRNLDEKLCIRERKAKPAA